MNLKLEIRRNADGEIATDTWAEWSYNTYWWKDGNASCDCNRRLFFERARGNGRDRDWEGVECSEGGYSVRLSDADTGEVLYDELSI